MKTVPPTVTATSSVDQFHTLNDRKPEQCVRSHQRADQECSQPGVASQNGDRCTNRKWNGKRQKTKHQRPSSGASKLGQIDLRPGKKHQQQLANLGKEIGNRTPVGEGLKAVGTKDNPCK